MSALVFAEHENGALRPSTLHAVAAAAEMSDQVVVLVAGKDCGPAAEAAAKVAGVSKVVKVDSAEYEHPLAENLAPLIAKQAAGHGHVVATATTVGKNIMPRVAALLDVAQVSDIIAVIDADTFVRPIYAGNALATVKSSDAVKVVTVRGTNFEPAAAEGGSAAIEDGTGEGDKGLSSFVGQALSKSDRPELTSARVGARKSNRLNSSH